MDWTPSSVADKPSRGEVWYVDLEPIRGHEQGRSRPCVIVSHDDYNHGPSSMVAVVPMTRTSKGIRLHVAIDPPDGGVKSRTFVQCDQVRTVSIERVSSKWGTLSDASMREIDDHLRTFLGLARSSLKAFQ